MEDRDIYRVFEQIKPTHAQEEAILDRLCSEERTRRPMKRMRKTIAVLVAAALLLMTCAFTIITGLDQRLLDFLGGTSEEEPLLSRAAVPVEASATEQGITMEIKQVLADPYSVLFLLEFTAPEHVALDQDSCTFGTTYYNLINDAGESLTRTSYSYHWYPVDQENPTDNRLEMICLVTSSENTVVANAGEEHDYESLLTEQNITEMFFSVRAALSEPRQGAAEDDARWMTWQCSFPFSFQDTGWQVSVPAASLTLGGNEVHVTGIYLSPLTLNLQLQGIDRDMYDAVQHTRGGWLDQIVLRDREGTVVPFDQADSFPGADFLRGTATLTICLADIQDPAACQGGTLTICGQTISLGELAPVG